MSDWSLAKAMVAWLDRRNPRDEAGLEELQRLTKLGEEVGEVFVAYSGMRGNNPRKGWTHTREDVANEIMDVIFGGMVALVSWTPEGADHRKMLESHITLKVERALRHE